MNTTVYKYTCLNTHVQTETSPLVLRSKFGRMPYKTPSMTHLGDYGQRVINWVKVYVPLNAKIRHFKYAIPSQSDSKLNLTQQKHTCTNKPVHLAFSTVQLLQCKTLNFLSPEL